MNHLALIFSLLMMANTLVIFDFNEDSIIDRWIVVDDVVMGGRSNGKIYLNKDGHGVFSGSVSTENNGGFSSVRHRFDLKKVKGYSNLIIRLKGDAKRYQIRVKSNATDYFSYISYVSTTGDWQTICIKLSEMYPTFRGRKLDMPNYPKETLGEVAFLIGNKKTEKFELFIDKIILE